MINLKESLKTRKDNRLSQIGYATARWSTRSIRAVFFGVAVWPLHTMVDLPKSRKTGHKIDRIWLMHTTMFCDFSYLLPFSSENWDASDHWFPLEIWQIQAWNHAVEQFPVHLILNLQDIYFRVINRINMAMNLQRNLLRQLFPNKWLM